jgi:hypothetical protein
MPSDVLYVRGRGLILDEEIRKIPGPRYIGGFRWISRSELPRISYKTYSSPSEARPMARSAATQAVPWETFRWVVGGLLALIVALLAGGFTWLITDVREVRNEIVDARKDNAKEISDTRVQVVKEVSGIHTEIADARGQLFKELADTRLELVKAIGAIETQAAATNTKLDNLVAVLQGQRRR